MSNDNIAALAKGFRKRAGRGGVLSDPVGLSHVSEFISTGCVPLDIIMGGGVPLGRLIEIHGETSSGKSLIALQVLAECQKSGGIGVLLDTESTTSTDIAEAVGVNCDDLIYDVPETMEQVWQSITAAVEAKAEMEDPKQPMVIVWDSIASTAAQEEIDKMKKDGLNSRTMGVHARLLSGMGRNLPILAAKNNISMVFINQVREKIGVMFGDTIALPGGKAVPFYSSIMVQLSVVSKVKEQGRTVGEKVRATVTKNKVAPPWRTCTFPIYFGSGANNPEAILEWIKDNELGGYRGGVWSKLTLPSGEVKWQGKDGWLEVYNANQAEIHAVCYSATSAPSEEVVNVEEV